MTWRCIGLLLSLAILPALPGRADVIHLKDGSTLDGDLRRGADGYIVTLPGGKTRTLQFEDVKSIEVGANSSAPTADQATRNLASLRRSLANVDDPQTAIDKYQRFIESAAGTPAEVEARKDLAAWQQRADERLVKVGSQWVTPEQRTTMHEQAIEEASVARRLLRQGKLTDAQKAIDQALTDDPASPAALYLRGLVQYSTGQIPQARASFEQVNRLVPGNVAVLNNLAVVAARQNQPNIALGYYDQAMNASPSNRFVLDNIAEALYTLPASAASSPIALRVNQKFAQQDAVLADQMEKKGMHRWGATWVTTDQLNQLSIAEKQTNDKLDQMASDFDKLQVRLNNIDRDIQENQRAQMTLGAGVGYGRDLNGQIYATDNSQTQAQLAQDNQRLAAEREDTLAQLNRLTEQARGAKRTLPVPKYTGIQRLMDESFAPIVAPTPATQPATAPEAQPATQS